MALSVEEAAKELKTREYVFVAYSQATRLPYVVCDEESGSFNDQVMIFATEEEIKKYGEVKIQEKILLFGMKYEKKDYGKLYGILYAIGVTSVVWHDGEDKAEVELEVIAKQADFSNLEPNRRPLLNPTLQLTAIYFMQALRRPVSKEERGNLRGLEEELLVNLVKSEYLVVLNADQEDPKQIHIPYLKNKEGKILQPIFSDIMEFEKFAKGKKLRAIKVPFARLPEFLIRQADACVVNPMGFNLILEREQMDRLVENVKKASKGLKEANEANDNNEVVE